MDNSKNNFVDLLKLITNSCNAIASYSVVVLITLFFPVRSAAIHNKYHGFVEKIFIPVACFITVICLVQILFYLNDFIKTLNTTKQKIFFGIIGFISSGSLCFISYGMLYAALQQLGAL